MITSFALFTGRRCAHVVIAVITTFFGFLCGPLLTIQNKIEIDTTIDNANTNTEWNQHAIVNPTAKQRKLPRAWWICPLVCQYQEAPLSCPWSASAYVPSPDPQVSLWQLRSCPICTTIHHTWQSKIWNAVEINQMVLIIGTIYEFAEIIDQNCTDRWGRWDPSPKVARFWSFRGKPTCIIVSTTNVILPM